jgi:hypothetical protein
MTTPEVVRCPDGHFRHAIYGIGPYIADYPEQVWLAAIVQDWCPKYAPISSFWFLLNNYQPLDLDVMHTQMTSTLKMLGGGHTKRLNF